MCSSGNTYCGKNARASPRDEKARSGAAAEEERAEPFSVAVRTRRAITCLLLLLMFRGGMRRKLLVRGNGSRVDWMDAMVQIEKRKPMDSLLGYESKRGRTDPHVDAGIVEHAEGVGHDALQPRGLVAARPEPVQEAEGGGLALCVCWGLWKCDVYGEMDGSRWR